jgi:hypothetical protein
VELLSAYDTGSVRFGETMISKNPFRMVPWKIIHGLIRPGFFWGSASGILLDFGCVTHFSGSAGISRVDPSFHFRSSPRIPESAL